MIKSSTANPKASATTDGHSFVIGRLEGGRFAACSKIAAPYFFFVGNSREEVIEIADRALTFYFDCAGIVLDENASIANENVAVTRSKFRPLEKMAL